MSLRSSAATASSQSHGPTQACASQNSDAGKNSKNMCRLRELWPPMTLIRPTLGKVKASFVAQVETLPLQPASTQIICCGVPQQVLL
jgi:hypothetical protein